MSRKSVISIDSSSDDNESDAPALPGTAKLRVGTTSLENSINGGPWTAVGNGTNLGWTTNGRSAIAIGANNGVITNSLVTATSLVFAQLATNDATLTQILRCVPAAGSFTITGNANATAATNVSWRVEN